MTTAKILLLLLCVGTAAMAQDKEETLNEVDVTGLTGGTQLSKQAMAVSVAKMRELNTLAYTNIIDAVASLPGVSQITTGSGISKPVIRGLGYNRIVVVNDGIRQEGQQWGDEHGIEVDGNSICSVEIIKGPASLMYGSDAMAGVMIMHDAPKLPQGEVRGCLDAEYQTNNGLAAYSLDLAGHQGRAVWDVRYSDKRAHDYRIAADGYVPNSRLGERALTGSAGTSHALGYSNLKLGWYSLTPGMVEDDGEAENSYRPEAPFQRVNHGKAVLDNSLNAGSGTLKVLLGWQVNNRREYEDEDECELDMMLHTLNYDCHWQNGVVAAGLNGMWQHSANRGEEELIPDYRLWDIGAFATATKTLGRTTLSGGLRYDERGIHLPSTHLNYGGATGSVGATHSVGQGLTLRLNAARGFRTPNISELASDGVHEGTLRYEVGNADLRAEHSWQFDAGADYSAGRITARLALFANLIGNYIFSERVEGAELDGYPVYQYVQGRARLMGGEASLDIHIVKPLHFENAFSYVSAVQPGQPTESRYLPMTPAPRLTSHLRYDLPTRRPAFVAASVEHNMRQSHYYAAGGTETATPAYTLLNASAGTDIYVRGRRAMTLTITASNLTNRVYQSHLSRLKYVGYHNMGRNVALKVSVPLTAR